MAWDVPGNYVKKNAKRKTRVLFLFLKYKWMVIILSIP